MSSFGASPLGDMLSVSALPDQAQVKKPAVTSGIIKSASRYTWYPNSRGSYVISSTSAQNTITFNLTGNQFLDNSTAVLAFRVTGATLEDTGPGPVCLANACEIFERISISVGGSTPYVIQDPYVLYSFFKRMSSDAWAKTNGGYDFDFYDFTNDLDTAYADAIQNNQYRVVNRVTRLSALQTAGLDYMIPLAWLPIFNINNTYFPLRHAPIQIEITLRPTITGVLTGFNANPLNAAAQLTISDMRVHSRGVIPNDNYYNLMADRVTHGAGIAMLSDWTSRQNRPIDLNTGGQLNFTINNSFRFLKSVVIVARNQATLSNSNAWKSTGGRFYSDTNPGFSLNVNGIQYPMDGRDLRTMPEIYMELLSAVGSSVSDTNHAVSISPLQFRRPVQASTLDAANYVQSLPVAYVGFDLRQYNADAEEVLQGADTRAGGGMLCQFNGGSIAQTAQISSYCFTSSILVLKDAQVALITL